MSDLKSNEPDSRPPPPQKRKPYTAPELVVIGTIRDLTRGNATVMSADAVSGV